MSTKLENYAAYFAAVETMQNYVKTETARIRTIPDDSQYYRKLDEIENYYRGLMKLKSEAAAAWQVISNKTEDEYHRNASRKRGK